MLKDFLPVLGSGEGDLGLGAMGGLGFGDALDTVTGGSGLAGILVLLRLFSAVAGLDVSTGEAAKGVLGSDLVVGLVGILVLVAMLGMVDVREVLAWRGGG